MEQTTIDIEARAARAAALFRQGFNCAQSVAGAYCDHYRVDDQLMLRMAASFGGGIGRMRETCGAACGMFLLAGLESGSYTPGDHAGKSSNYADVQQLAAAFVRANGALRCADLLGLGRKPQGTDTEKAASLSGAAPSAWFGQPEAEPRTPQYYAKRPCVQIVQEAARIFGTFLQERQSLIGKSGLSVRMDEK